MFIRKFVSFAVASFLVAGLSVNIFAQGTGAGVPPSRDVIVTEVEVTPVDEGAVKGLARVLINNVLEISEIQVLKVGGRTSLKFPEYVSKKGKVYPQITVHTKQANDAILNAVTTGKPSGEKSKAISFKVTKFSKFTRPSKLKVFAAVMFNDAIEVECKIMEGNKGPWVSWPSRRPEGGGKWINQVAIKNKAVKDAIEKTLLERYAKMLQESGASGGAGEEYE